MRIGTRMVLPILCLIWIAGLSPAASADGMPLFANHDAQALHVELHLPLSELKRNHRKDDASVEAEILLAGGDKLPLAVRPRGKSRLSQCDYFPLWLDFKKKSTAGTVFAGQNKLKLVTHCADKYASRGYLAREYLAYRVLNHLTDASFRVRPLRITYVDTGRKDWRRTHDAFLIEHKKHLAERLDAEILDVKQVRVREMDAGYASLVSLFQYLLGNTDFSMRKGPAGDKCCHNVVPLKLGEVVMPIPYDFDVSGFVNPPYAEPQPAIGIQRVTQRRFRGYCAHNSTVHEARETLLAAQTEIVAMIDSFAAFDGLRRDKLQKFVQGFFDDLAAEKRFKRRILKRCRG